MNKAISILGVIRRRFEYLDARTFRLLYINLVIPHLEYADAVWNPHKMIHIDIIENVQRRATKLVPGLNTLDYENELRELNLPTLSYRQYSSCPKDGQNWQYTLGQRQLNSFYSTTTLHTRCFWLCMLCRQSVHR